MPTNVEITTAPKSVTCTICRKKFSRTDHLKRHQLGHSGVKPYACVFCHDAFTRSDNLRDHYPNCPQRNGRVIPDSARGGRRSHACDSCTSRKLGCDGNNPCKTCRNKGIECKFSKLLSKSSPAKRSSTPTKQGQENTAPSDRGSVKFLLNSGTASFIECFRFPSSEERRNINNFRSPQNEPRDQDVLQMFGNNSENGSTYGNGSTFSDPFEKDPIDWALFENENIRFRCSPFPDQQMQYDDIFAPVIFMDPNFATPVPTTANFQFPEEWEPPSPQSTTIVHALLNKATALDVTLSEEFGLHLNYLFTPSKIERLVGLYFEFWHPHCPIIHQPSFNIETVPIPLLISITLMGAMYSHVDQDVSTAKRISDLAEAYIFSLDDLREESEICHILGSLTGASLEQSTMLSPLVLQNLQGAYLMICVQFWAGNVLARKRCIDTRFGVLVKLARRLDLPNASHAPVDGLDELPWVDKECRIRLINIMTLLDCAFSFFANFPCRFSVAEMKFDLPCEEFLFSSPHPFSEPKFKVSRQFTTYEAFKSLFLPEKSSPLSTGHGKKNPLGLNAMDMFILIHLLYVYTHSQITLFSSSTSRTSSFSGTTTPTTPSSSSAPDSNLTSIKSALARWRTIWTAVRSTISPSEWSNLGFFRNGYNYWLVIQLLVNNKRSAEVMMRMEVNCEDTLKQLKALLKDGGNDT